MKKLMIGLAAVFAVACTSQVEDVSYLDAHLAQDGVYGTFAQGDVKLEFASFEIEPGVFSVTVVGEDFAIDTLILPPERAQHFYQDRPMTVVDYGPTKSTTGDLGTFLLPPEREQLFYQDRPMTVVDYGPAKSTTGDLGTFLLPPDGKQLFYQDRPMLVVDYGPVIDDDLGDLGAKLIERYPDQPRPVVTLLRVLGAY